MKRRDKIQYLLITHLLKEGKIDLMLPGGTVLELGITQEGKNGPETCDGYCWVQASQDERSTYIDQYNVNLQYTDETSILLFDRDGEERHIVDVV